MNFITKKHISRRTVLHGMGAAVALPFLESMVPAQTPTRETAANSPARLAAIEIVHGCAGASPWGRENNLWVPKGEGPDFDLTGTSMAPLEPLRDYLTLVSNTDCRNAEAFVLSEVGADHFRSSAVFLTQSKPRMTEGSDVYAGTSIDQLYAQRFGQDTPVPSIQLCIEAVDVMGGCVYGYSCAYRDTISWASPSDPMPMTRDPRVVFDQLFGAGGTTEERAARRDADRSILDWIGREVARLEQDLSASDKARLGGYLEEVREIERRIQKIEEYNASGDARQVPDAPVGVPDSVHEHMKLMYDLQALAFAAGITRVSTLKLSKDATGRVYPDSGHRSGFHGMSHFGSDPDRITAFASMNEYHVGLLKYFLDKLKDTPDGDGNLLDHSLVVYGSPMGDASVHNHKRCPLILAGHANGALAGNFHFNAEDGTPMANAWVTVMQRMGLENMEDFGDSTGEIAI